MPCTCNSPDCPHCGRDLERIEDGGAPRRCPRCHGDEYGQPCAECGAGKLPGEAGFRPDVYRRDVEEELLRRCVRAVEAMPDFAGRTARPDGLTHCCAGCGTWLAEDDIDRAPDGRGWCHDVPEYDRHGEATRVPCGPVHDLSPVEGVLRSDVIAVLRRVLTEEGTP